MIDRRETSFFGMLILGVDVIVLNWNIWNGGTQKEEEITKVSSTTSTVLPAVSLLLSRRISSCIVPIIFALLPINLSDKRTNTFSKCQRQ